MLTVARGLVTALALPLLLGATACSGGGEDAQGSDEEQEADTA